MSIGFFIILIVVMALIIGPLAMMRPSPAQKQKEHFRLLAREKGIHFSTRRLPQQADDKEIPAPISVYLLAPVNPERTDDWLLLRTNYQHELHFLGWWSWEGGREASAIEQEILKSYLPAFSESVRAVSSGSKGICVYWTEKGDENLLNQLFSLLKQLQSAGELQINTNVGF